MNLTQPARGLRRSQTGLSMVELMVAVALGLMLMAGLATLFASTSRSRQELERSARQIENGRYAMELLTDDLRMAGFYGELSVPSNRAASGTLDPCSTNQVDWDGAIPIGVQHYDVNDTTPTCLSGNRKVGTDMVVIRRVKTCEAGVGTCPVATNGRVYMQSKKCSTQLAPPAGAFPEYFFDKFGVAPFTLQQRNCTTAAGLREYVVNAYWIGADNGRGENIATLWRASFNGTSFDREALVEGIEELNIEYGLDIVGQPGDPVKLDGQPDVWTADPRNYTAPGCTVCNPVDNLRNIVAARVYLLARAIDPSPNYTDTKTYSLGRDRTGTAIEVTPGGPYRRQAYSGIARVVNVAQRRETP